MEFRKPKESTVAGFVRIFEDAYSSGDESKILDADEKLSALEGRKLARFSLIFEMLVQSSNDEVRHSSARNLGILADNNAEAAANSWLLLLRDANKEVARQANNTFDSSCYAIERGFRNSSTLEPLSEIFKAKSDEKITQRQHN
jgi:hypothetical protein